MDVWLDGLEPAPPNFGSILHMVKSETMRHPVHTDALRAPVNQSINQSINQTNASSGLVTSTHLENFTPRPAIRSPFSMLRSLCPTSKTVLLSRNRLPQCLPKRGGRQRYVRISAPDVQSNINQSINQSPINNQRRTGAPPRRPSRCPSGRVRRPQGTRGGSARSSARAGSAGSPRSPRRPTSPPREAAPGACPVIIASS